MKLYSSTFLSAVLGFLMLLGQSNTPIELKEGEKDLFRTILRHETESSLSNSVPVTIYTGLTCPECRNFNRFTVLPLYESLKEEKKAELEVVLVPNIEDEMDILGSKAAYCAAEQQQFWAMLKALFEMEVIDLSTIQEKTTEWEMDAEAFNNCLESETTQAKLEESAAKWMASELEQLPSTALHDVNLMGAHPVENIQREIRRLLPLLIIED